MGSCRGPKEKGSPQPLVPRLVTPLPVLVPWGEQKGHRLRKIKSPKEYKQLRLDSSTPFMSLSVTWCSPGGRGIDGDRGRVQEHLILSSTASRKQ